MSNNLQIRDLSFKNSSGQEELFVPKTTTDAVEGLNELLTSKQDKLVSGTNIKTINGNDITGSGDVTIEAGGGVGIKDENTVFPAEGPLLTDEQKELLKGEVFNQTLDIALEGGRIVRANKAIGMGSHAEGFITTASGVNSHAEGYNTTATGMYSHAEGYFTTASGDSSHAEGFITTAENYALHSQGCYNTKETIPSPDRFDETKILFSIGNGSTDTDRSDALKMLGNGTTWIAGIGDFNGKNPTEANSLQAVLTSKQDKLVSGTNIKTVNGESIVGTGDIKTIGRSYKGAEGEGEIFNHSGNKANAYAHAEGGGEGEIIEAPSPFKRSFSKIPAETRSIILDNNGYSVKIPYATNIEALYVDILEPTSSAFYEKWFQWESLKIEVTANGEPIMFLFMPRVELIPEYLIMDYHETNFSKEQIVEFYNIFKQAYDSFKTITFTVGKPMLATRPFNEAIGIASHAEGTLTQAYGECSHAEGHQTTANNSFSHAEGYNTTASGDSSHAEGGFTTASGNLSHAEGRETTASGEASHAEGEYTTASGRSSHAEGNHTIASGMFSHAEGSGTASGVNSHAEGVATRAENYAQHSQGRCNTKDSNPSSDRYDETKILFSVGNGSDDTHRSDALKMLGNGQTWLTGALNQKTADYAEMFEWSDGNTKDEDRVGYFVTMKDDKIVKATSKDSYILGIVSAAPAIIGDNPNLWHGLYINDEWGRPIYEDVEVKYTTYETNEQGERVEVEKTRTDHIRKINPEWKSEEPYIDRTKRKEWDAIGLMGKLLVRQDGTLKVGSFCKPNDQGIATKSTTGYYVMKVNNKNQALVLFR